MVRRPDVSAWESVKICVQFWPIDVLGECVSERTEQ